MKRGYFEPVKMISNYVWAIKNSKRPITAKRTLNVMKVLYVIYFSGEGDAIQVPVKKLKKRYWKILQSCGLNKLSETVIQSWVLNMCDLYMIMPLPIRLP